LTEAESDFVKSEFEVSITLPQRRGRFGRLHCHTEIEKLGAIAKERVLLFCRMLQVDKTNIAIATQNWALIVRNPTAKLSSLNSPCTTTARWAPSRCREFCAINVV
jgi:hypothetical protein